jgi:hypothetical protein
MTFAMPHRIFFFWQSDTSNAVGRTMIEACLERAIGALQADVEIDLADRELSVNKDTLHVPGSPPIVDTIYGKIDQPAVFLSDLTCVALRPDGGGIPNPNVSIEHGWALKSPSSRRVISVMNTAMGHPDKHELPFDLRHIRRPICYACPPTPTRTRRRAKEDLSKQRRSSEMKRFAPRYALRRRQSRTHGRRAPPRRCKSWCST